jgi:hypothetical protein
LVYEGRVEIPFTVLTLPHFCGCLSPQPEHRFPTSYDVMVFFYVQEVEMKGY